MTKFCVLSLTLFLIFVETSFATTFEIETSFGGVVSQDYTIVTIEDNPASVGGNLAFDLGVRIKPEDEMAFLFIDYIYMNYPHEIPKGSNAGDFALVPLSHNLAIGIGKGWEVGHSELRFSGGAIYYHDEFTIERHLMSNSTETLSSIGFIGGLQFYFLFLEKVDALVGYKLLWKSSEIIDNEFDDGQSYTLEINDLEHIFMIGVAFEI